MRFVEETYDCLTTSGSGAASRNDVGKTTVTAGATSGAEIEDAATTVGWVSTIVDGGGEGDSMERSRSCDFEPVVGRDRCCDGGVGDVG